MLHKIRFLLILSLVVFTFVTFFVCDSASAAGWWRQDQSTRTKLCTSILLEQRAIDKANLIPARYTLNSILAFKNFVAKDVEVRGDFYNGFAWHKPGLPRVIGNFGCEQISAQLRGILDFERLDDERLQPKIAALTFVGTENIHSFLQAVGARAQTVETPEKRMQLYINTIAAAGCVIGAALQCVDFVTSGRLLPDLTILFSNASFIAGATMALTSIHNRFKAKTQHEVLEQFTALASEYGKGGWAVYSNYLRLDPDWLHVLKTDPEYDSALLSTIYAESLFIEDSLSHSTKKNGWLATDLILDYTRAEPELHVVTRFTNERPTFPDLESEKSDKSVAPPLSLRPLVPATIPVKK